MVPHYKITIDPDNPKPQINEIIKDLRPEWPIKGLKYKVFKEGRINALYGVYLQNPDDMILVKIVAESKELYVNRDHERMIINTLAPYGVAAPFYATFENGNVYEFIPGRLLMNSDVRVPEIADLIAGEIGRLHTVPVPHNYASSQNRGFCISEFEKLIKRLPEKLDDPINNERYQKHVLSFDFNKEIRDMEEMAMKLNEELVITHHDLWSSNIILSKDEKKVRFIDFEFSALDYGSIDIAVHFIVYINILEPDPVKYPYPTEQQQKRFITKYLESRYPDQDVTTDLIETWYKRVNKMAALAYLYWGVWCVLHGISSDIHFLGLGIIELEEYRKLKPRIMVM